MSFKTPPPALSASLPGSVPGAYSSHLTASETGSIQITKTNYQPTPETADIKATSTPRPSQLWRPKNESESAHRAYTHLSDPLSYNPITPLIMPTLMASGTPPLTTLSEQQPSAIPHLLFSIQDHQQEVTTHQYQSSIAELGDEISGLLKELQEHQLQNSKIKRPLQQARRQRKQAEKHLKSLKHHFKKATSNESDQLQIELNHADQQQVEAKDCFSKANQIWIDHKKIENNIRDDLVHLTERIHYIIQETKDRSQEERFSKFHIFHLYVLLSTLIENMPKPFLGHLPPHVFDDWYAHRLGYFSDEEMKASLMAQHWHKRKSVSQLIESNRLYTLHHPQWIIEEDQANQRLMKLQHHKSKKSPLSAEATTWLREEEELEMRHRIQTEITQSHFANIQVFLVFHYKTTYHSHSRIGEQLDPLISFNLLQELYNLHEQSKINGQKTQQALESHQATITPDIQKHKKWLVKLTKLQESHSKQKEIAFELASKFKPLHTHGMSNYIDGLNEENGILYDIGIEAINARNDKDTIHYEESLRISHSFHKLLVLADFHLLHTPISHYVIDENDGIQKSAWDVQSSKDSKPFKKTIQRRTKLLAIHDMMTELFPSFGQDGLPLPGAISIEPVGYEDGMDFSTQVIDKEMAAVYVPGDIWNCRVILPINAPQALEQAQGQTQYMMPGTNLKASTGVTCITSARDTCRHKKKWIQVPFIVDFPFHSYSPRTEKFGLKDNILEWVLGHLAGLKGIANKKPNAEFRSTSSLLGLEIAYFYPEFVRSIVAESPAGTTEDYQNFMGNHFMPWLLQLDQSQKPQGIDLSLNLAGFALMNGQALAKKLISIIAINKPGNPLVQGAEKLLSYFDDREQSLRLQFEALHQPPSSEILHTQEKPAPLLVLFSRDDTQQNPDDPDLFANPVKFPNIPYNQLWDEAAERFDHITSIGLLGSHRRFDPEHTSLRAFHRATVREFQKDPQNFKSRFAKARVNDPAAGQTLLQIARNMDTFVAFRKLKIDLMEMGVKGKQLVIIGENILRNLAKHDLKKRNSTKPFKQQILVKKAKRILEYWPKYNAENGKFENDEFLSYLKQTHTI